MVNKSGLSNHKPNKKNHQTPHISRIIKVLFFLLKEKLWASASQWPFNSSPSIMEKHPNLSTAQIYSDLEFQEKCVLVIKFVGNISTHIVKLLEHVIWVIAPEQLWKVTYLLGKVDGVAKLITEPPHAKSTPLPSHFYIDIPSQPIMKDLEEHH